MEDPDPSVRDLCERWWLQRDIWADQSLFQKGGAFHRPRQHNATRCWVWQVRQFLHTTFEHKDASGCTSSFRPLDLPPPLRERLVAQLSCHLGIYRGTWLPLLPHAMS